MSPVIECCVRNLSAERRERLGDAECDLRIRPCLEHCGVCRETPFRVLDGDLLVGGELRIDDRVDQTHADREGTPE